MTSRQLELGLQPAKCRSANRRGSRHNRRHQWFERMRQAVDAVPDAEVRTKSSRPPLAAAPPKDT